MPRIFLTGAYMHPRVTTVAMVTRARARESSKAVPARLRHPQPSIPRAVALLSWACPAPGDAGVGGRGPTKLSRITDCRGRASTPHSTAPSTSKHCSTDNTRGTIPLHWVEGLRPQRYYTTCCVGHRTVTLGDRGGAERLTPRPGQTHS